MRGLMMAALAAGLLGVCGAGMAQSVEALARAAINSEGKGCPTVTQVKAVGKTTSGTTIIAAACSDGGRHALKITPENTLDYVSTCAVLKSTAGVDCF